MQQKLKKEQRSLQLMGTKIELFAQHPQADLVIEEAANRLAVYEKRFSANDEASDLMKVNRAAGVHPVVVHPDLFELIEVGVQHSLDSQGALNIAIGPLVQTWRIGFSNARVPSQEEIDDLLKIVDPKQIELDSNTSSVFLKQAGMRIDLGALAKGYFADLIIDFFKDVGVRSGMINLGGNLLTTGLPPTERKERVWLIGIQDPHKPRGNNKVILKTYNQSVVTSGAYERHYTYKGKTYHHIFDSQTGYPIEADIDSITIVSNKSLDGELWTTRLYGKKPIEIMTTVQALEGIEALILTKEGKIMATPGIQKQIAQIL